MSLSTISRQNGDPPAESNEQNSFRFGLNDNPLGSSVGSAQNGKGREIPEHRSVEILCDLRRINNRNRLIGSSDPRNISFSAIRGSR
jgi:hypothetical protein